MRVYYENKVYNLVLSLRESLFPDYRDGNPDKEVKIINDQGVKKFVLLKELKLESEWRLL